MTRLAEDRIEIPSDENFPVWLDSESKNASVCARAGATSKRRVDFAVRIIAHEI